VATIEVKQKGRRDATVGSATDVTSQVRLAALLSGGKGQCAYKVSHDDLL
jgi:hypothetical protein